MNEMLKLMHDRRSTRAYRPEPLQDGGDPTDPGGRPFSRPAG